MPRNIEVKMKVRSIEAVRKSATRLGASFAGLLIQRDTFYRCSLGRLKLREVENSHAELIAYERSNEAEVRSSDYALAPTRDPSLLHAVLSRSLGVAGVVAKRRNLLLWRNVRIHLDVVEGLGEFIEFESVVGDVDEATAKQNLEELMRNLDLSDAEIIPVAYVDLLPGI